MEMGNKNLMLKSIFFWSPSRIHLSSVPTTQLPTFFQTKNFTGLNTLYKKYIS